MFKVGSSAHSSPASSYSLFYLIYEISTSSSSDDIWFSVPGLPNIQIRRSLTTTSYQRIKVDHRPSGASCITTLHLGGTEIYNEIHDCGSYTTGNTYVWAAGDDVHSNQAIGYVDTFNFVWL